MLLEMMWNREKQKENFDLNCTIFKLEVSRRIKINWKFGEN